MDTLDKAKLRYEALQGLLLSKNPDDAKKLVTDDFQIKPDEHSQPINLQALIKEVARLRVIFPDFGQNVKVEAASYHSGESMLVMTYVMTVTTSDTYQDKNGKKEAIRSGRTVRIVYQDRAAFDAAMKIRSIEITTDMSDIMEQLLE